MSQHYQRVTRYSLVLYFIDNDILLMFLKYVKTMKESQFEFVLYELGMRDNMDTITSHNDSHQITSIREATVHCCQSTPKCYSNNNMITLEECD
jgi:hypothetical protein